MKHRLYFSGKSFTHDSEISHTHVLIGQRNEIAERPSEEVMAKPTRERTEEEDEDVRKFVHDQMEGRFSMKPLAWAESEEHAEQLKGRFKAPTWINLSIVPVDRVATNA